MKVGALWPHPDRDYHGRESEAAGCELIYHRDSPSGFDLATTVERVQAGLDRGLEMHLRLDEEAGQTVPAVNDWDRRWEFILWAQGLAAHPVLGRCRTFGIGNEFNHPNEYRLSTVPLTAPWVTGIVYGYGRPGHETDNIYQFCKTVNPDLRICLGAIAPYQANEQGLQGWFYTPPDGRSNLSPWERHQYEYAYCSYNNNWHAPYEEISFWMHHYSRIGLDGLSNGSANEPSMDVREEIYSAQFGTKVLDDLLAAIHNANGFAPPPVVITEWNSLTDGWPADNYVDGLMQNVIQYVNFKPNVIAWIQFVDQDLGGEWTRTSISTRQGRLSIWDDDYNQVMQNGW